MIRNLKFLGLALVAALAMSSVAVSAASADELTSEAGATTLTGDQDGGKDVFKVHGGSVSCASVIYNGSISAAKVAKVTVTPTYKECTFAGLAATVNMNGCDYLVTLNTAAGNTTGTVDIECAAGKEITVTAPSVGTAKCIVHVPAQAGLETGTGTNIGSGQTREVTLTLDITEKIKYSQTMGTAETGNCATADSTTTGSYTGLARITGETGTTHVGIFLS